MSLYIPGMEMPKSCDECYFLGELGACDVLLAMNKKAADRCPLIEVPPHGRLIDADAFFETFAEMRDYEWASHEYDVIPADKEEP